MLYVLEHDISHAKTVLTNTQMLAIVLRNSEVSELATSCDTEPIMIQYIYIRFHSIRYLSHLPTESELTHLLCLNTWNTLSQKCTFHRLVLRAQLAQKRLKLLI